MSGSAIIKFSRTNLSRGVCSLHVPVMQECGFMKIVKNRSRVRQQCTAVIGTSISVDTARATLPKCVTHRSL